MFHTLATSPSFLDHSASGQLGSQFLIPTIKDDHGRNAHPMAPSPLRGRSWPVARSSVDYRHLMTFCMGTTGSQGPCISQLRSAASRRTGGRNISLPPCVTCRTWHAGTTLDTLLGLVTRPSVGSLVEQTNVLQSLDPGRNGLLYQLALGNFGCESFNLLKCGAIVAAVFDRLVNRHKVG